MIIHGLGWITGALVTVRLDVCLLSVLSPATVVAESTAVVPHTQPKANAA